MCEATGFVSALVIVFYLLPTILAFGSRFSLDLIDIRMIILPLVTFIAAIVCYFLPPVRVVTTGLYVLLVATASALIFMTGQTTSPFLALWIIVSVFAGVYGLLGYSLVGSIVLAFGVYLFLKDDASANVYTVLATAGAAPLVASFIIWHARTKDDKRDRAYNELASELSHEANRSETVISTITDGVISIDKQGLIQLMNPAAARIIGWSQGDAIGLSYQSVIKLFDRKDKPVEQAADPIAQVLNTNQEAKTYDLNVHTEGGKRIMLALNISPIGQPSTGAIIAFRDITKEKAEEQQQAEFISTASHEMRTPVASIEGYLGLALNPATATIDDKARDYITKAHESAQHLGRLFQDLLDVSKAEDGRLNNNPKVVDVVEHVADIVDALRQRATDKGLRFFFKQRPDGNQLIDRLIVPVFYANVDNDHLREVLSNLIENAIKYTPSGDIIVDVTSDDVHVTISVQDSGLGIPVEDIPHLFQKFYRVDSSDTREIGGTGLGLYLCRRLAEVMGGQIRVESEYKKGSTFYLDIPRIDHQEAQRLMEASAIAENSITREEPKQQVQLVESNPEPAPTSVVEVPTTPLPPPPVPPIPTIPSTQPTIESIEQQLRSTNPGRQDVTIPGR